MGERAPRDSGRVNVALVHDWLTGMRGGEKVLDRIARRFPGAPIYTLVHRPGTMSPEIESHPIHTSFLQRFPGAVRRYRWYLPFFPAAIESFDLSRYDVVVSTSHAVAKGVRTGRGTFHLSYIHTPMRYIWDLESQYFPPGRFPWPLSWVVPRILAGLRGWDRRTADRPAVLLTNSAFVADRIRRHWGRNDARVVFPPVDVERLRPAAGPRDDYYLLAGAFAPYKRGELAIEACVRLGRRVVVAGSGQEERRLRRWEGNGVEFRGWVTDEQLDELYGGARALLFPGEEDFGIMPVEAMARGCPVIAYGRGGVLESVGRGASSVALDEIGRGGLAAVPGGVLFGRQDAGQIAEAIQRLEAGRFDPIELHEQASPFSVETFDHAFDAAFTGAYEEWRRSAGAGAAKKV